MALNITTNTAALRAGEILSKNQRLLEKSFSLSSGKKINSPVDDPGSLAVGMKLQASINRLAGAHNNVQNALSFSVQDGLLNTAGEVVARMNELPLYDQDPIEKVHRILQVITMSLKIYSYNYTIFHEWISMGLAYLLTSHLRSRKHFFTANSKIQGLDNTVSIFISTLGNSGAKSKHS